jgi:hypothetical protein
MRVCKALRVWLERLDYLRMRNLIPLRKNGRGFLRDPPQIGFYEIGETHLAAWFHLPPERALT